MNSPEAAISYRQRRELSTNYIEIVSHGLTAKLILRRASPLLAVRVFRPLPHLGMSAGQQERTGVANLRLDQAQVAGRIKQTRIPAFPVGQQLFHFIAQVHERNVTEQMIAGNDRDLVFGAALLLQ